jgi:eukaryotic-like serine/threonine-protein kinase
MGNEQHASAPHMESEPLLVGRYELAAQLARGGLATVYAARLRGDGGLRRTVAVKRLHAQFRTDGDITTMFLDEARVALRVRHPNVVHAVDVVLHEDELFIVMEYVEGASLSQLLRNVGKLHQEVPLDIAVGIVANVLHGLHAAHTTCDERGLALEIVHRDVSPQNVLVGSDGIARVLDFGIAKTVSQAHVTRANEIKGKLTYMAPEQLLGKPLTRKADIFSTGIILWETLTGHRLFYGDNDGAIIRSILHDPIPAPSTLNPAVSPELDAVVLHALERDPSQRFGTAEEMASRLEEVAAIASPRTIGQWVKANASEELRARAELIARVEGNCADASWADEISRSRPVVARTATTNDDAEPPALAQALRAMDAQRQASAPRRRWARTVVPIVLGIVVGVGGVGAWRRSTAHAVGAAPSTGEDLAVVVPPLTVPASAAVAASAGTATAPGPAESASATAAASPSPASAPSAAPPRVVRGGSPVRSAPPPPPPRTSPTASVNRYSRF